MIFGLDDQLPKFEASVRELVHPLFEKLKAEVGHAVLCCAALHHPALCALQSSLDCRCLLTSALQLLALAADLLLWPLCS
jgi:hypothetical protein